MPAKKDRTILMSGGSGLLGSTLLSIDPTIVAPSHSEMDILDPLAISANIKEHSPDVFLHAAAFTSPPRCDEHPIEALKANIIGTANVVVACAEYDVRLVYVSTDYVFRGDRGNYAEGDEVHPQNRYAWSKLGGECAVRMYNDALIIRTSFSPDEFPYEAAFVDQYTSRDSVSVIAGMIHDLLYTDETGVLHVGTERKSVKNLAHKLGSKDVKDLHRDDVSFAVPGDTSFDLTKFKSIYGK